MTSVSSDVTMTAFEPVLAACRSFKRKRVSASSCVDCSPATSTHSSAVILKQVSSQVTHNALPCCIHLYRCSFDSPTKNLMRLACWRNCIGLVSTAVCCVPPQALLLNGCACTINYSERLNRGACRRFSLSEYLMDSWRYASKPTTTLPLCTPTYSTMDKTDSASCGNVFMVPFILCTTPIPSMMQVDGVRVDSTWDTFFSSSVAIAGLFVFRRDPSAFASAHGSGPSGWAKTSFMFTLILSATRIIWLKRFRSAFRTTFWHLSRECADCWERFLYFRRCLVVEFYGWWIIV